eukprot:CAMPEP_0170478094 /NCGR_PEP_ID=MMETSP0123-20130129/19216_1 /TAXON_ID=182087 /ORGANISM="Favella ehrenbergii, Strain Fehren 1" /LENGTH=58 /DNA_ID=CAMNT_0010750203 /DNA_START=156 /DNA_END=332 /DNA_ORIENTATION=-
MNVMTRISSKACKSSPKHVWVRSKKVTGAVAAPAAHIVTKSAINSRAGKASMMCKATR